MSSTYGDIDWGEPAKPPKGGGGGGIEYPPETEDEPGSSGTVKKPKPVSKKAGGLHTQEQVEADTALLLEGVNDQIRRVQADIQKNETLAGQVGESDTAAVQGELQRLQTKLDGLNEARNKVARGRFKPTRSVRMREADPLVTVLPGVSVPATGGDPSVRQSTPSRSAALGAPPETTLRDPKTGKPVVTYTDPQQRQRVAAARVAAKLGMVNKRHEEITDTLSDAQDQLSALQGGEASLAGFPDWLKAGPDRPVGGGVMAGGGPPDPSAQQPERAARVLKARIAQLQEESDRQINLKEQLAKIQRETLGGYTPSKTDVKRFGASVRAEGLEFDPAVSARASAERKAIADVEFQPSTPTPAIDR